MVKNKREERKGENCGTEEIKVQEAEKEGTPAIVGKYRRLTLKGARIGHIVFSGILPVKGGRSQENRNHRMMAIKAHVQKVCMEEERVGNVDMWFNLVGRNVHEKQDSSDWEGCCRSCVSSSGLLTRPQVGGGGGTERD